MYQINETKMVPEILSLWAGGSNVKLYWFKMGMLVKPAFSEGSTNKDGSTIE